MNTVGDFNRLLVDANQVIALVGATEDFAKTYSGMIQSISSALWNALGAETQKQRKNISLDTELPEPVKQQIAGLKTWLSSQGVGEY